VRRRGSAAALAVRCGIAAVMLLSLDYAVAGAMQPCADPRVFPAAVVNVVVLPYRYEGPAGVTAKNAADVGEQLSALIQTETLLSMLKYGSVAATRLYSNFGEACNPRDVFKFLTRSGGGRLKAGNGLVMISGRIYLKGTQIYLQTYLWFLRQGVNESIEVPLTTAGGPDLVLRSELATQVIALQPRTITTNDLKSVQLAFRTDMVVRAAPDEKAPTVPIALDVHTPLSYSVVESKGDWMKISLADGAAGWMRARASAEGWALRKFLPELGFVDALVGYEAITAGGAAGSNRQAAAGWITQDLANYETAVGPDAAPLTLAMGRVLRGFLLWNQPGMAESPAARRQAAGLFAESLRFAPENAEIRNLAAITRPWLGSGGAGASLDGNAWKVLDVDLVGALAVDSKNKTTLQNLERVYEYEVSHPQGALPGIENPSVTGRLGAAQKLEIIRFSLESVH
jgi:hypothetical protein